MDKKPEPKKYYNLEERIAWDNFAAAALSNLAFDMPHGAALRDESLRHYADFSAEWADLMMAKRAERFGSIQQRIDRARDRREQTSTPGDPMAAPETEDDREMTEHDCYGFAIPEAAKKGGC